MDELRLQKLTELGEPLEEEVKRTLARQGFLNWEIPEPTAGFLNSIERGDLWLHTSPTGMGKTSFAFKCAIYWATRANPLKVTFVSAEQTLASLQEKMERVAELPPRGSRFKSRTYFPKDLGLVHAPEGINSLLYIGSGNTEVLILDGFPTHNLAPHSLKEVALGRQIAIFVTCQTPGTGLRPSEIIFAADVVTATEREEDRILLRFLKSRELEMPTEPVKMRFKDTGGLVFEE